MKLLTTTAQKKARRFHFDINAELLFIRKILFSARFGLEIGGIIVDEECRPRTKNIKLKFSYFVAFLLPAHSLPHNNGQPVK